MTKTEFLSEFTGEPREITALISNCWEKGDQAFPMLEDMYKCEARFESAIDSVTGEPIETRMFNWLHWLAPKKLFGYPYLYPFKKNKVYRLIVRQAEPKTGAEFFSYLVEKLVEAEVDEPRLDPKTLFESAFQTKEEEMLILTERDSEKTTDRRNVKMICSRFMASVNAATGAMSVRHGSISWLEEKCPGVKLRKKKIYRVLVRRAENGNMLLSKFLGEERNFALEEFLMNYNKPQIITNRLGVFQLNREEETFEGKIKYPGGPASVSLEMEDNGGAETALKSLERICSDIDGFDAQIREFAADELYGYVPDWYDEDISPEEFKDALGVPFIYVFSDGSVDTSFDGGEIFCDHGVFVKLDPEGRPLGADLVG